MRGGPGWGEMEEYLGIVIVSASICVRTYFTFNYCFKGHTRVYTVFKLHLSPI